MHLSKEREVDEAVWNTLSEAAISFPDLEQAIKLPVSHMQVRQSAWRLINCNKAELTRDLKVKRK